MIESIMYSIYWDMLVHLPRRFLNAHTSFNSWIVLLFVLGIFAKSGTPGEFEAYADGSRQQYVEPSSLDGFELITAYGNSVYAESAANSTSTYLLTENDDIAVLLSWEPADLSKDISQNLLLRFSDGLSGKPIVNADVEYDLTILDQEGKAVYDMSNEVAVNGTNQYYDIEFPRDETYNIVINVKKVLEYGGGDPNTANLDGLARGIVVVPEFSASSAIVTVAMIVILSVTMFGSIFANRSGIRWVRAW
jgi:hypothetical protein